MSEYILSGMSVFDLEKKADEIKAIYDEYGIIIFPAILLNDDAFKKFHRELSLIFDEILSRHSKGALPKDLGDKLVNLNRLCPLDGKIITDLGTQPNKINSFNLIKYSVWMDKLLLSLFGKQSILATPQAGDTLHFFAPGEAFRRYNLPPHQDYQYLMQSPKQATCYLGLSNYKDDVGGLRFWEKSHKLGILKSHKNKFGSFEVTNYENVLRDFNIADFHWNPGDLGFFDSLLVHSSIPNYSKDNGRVVQIFRFSDINNPLSLAINYRSTCYERRSVGFEEVHPDLYQTVE